MVEKAFAAAEVRHQDEYYVPIEHHNPMELFASTVIWDGDGKLTVYDKTQGVQNVQRYLCGVFDMKPDDVRETARRHLVPQFAQTILGPNDRTSTSSA